MMPDFGKWLDNYMAGSRGEPDFKALTPIVDALRASADELERQGIVCISLDRAIESLSYLVRAKEIVWDISRRQPAPPAGEPDFEERRAMFIDFCALHKFGIGGWPKSCLDQFETIMRQVYRLGQRSAARQRQKD